MAICKYGDCGGQLLTGMWKQILFLQFYLRLQAYFSPVTKRIKRSYASSLAAKLISHMLPMPEGLDGVYQLAINGLIFS